MRDSTSTIDMLLKSNPETRSFLATRSMPLKAQWRILRLGLLVSDITMTALAFRIAYFIRFELSLAIFQLEVVPKVEFYQSLVLFLIPLWLMIFAASGLYNRRNLLGGIAEYAKIFNATSTGMMAVIVTSFLQIDFFLSRGWLLLAWLLSFLMTASARFALRRVIYSLRRRGFFLTPALIVGANEEGSLLAEQLNSWSNSGLYVLGFVDDKKRPREGAQSPHSILGGIGDIDSIIRKYGVEELVMATSAFTREEMLQIFKRYGVSDQVNLRLSSGLFEIITTGIEVKELAYVPLVSINKVRLTGFDRVLKLILDYFITIPGLIAIAPMMLMIAIAIKLDSRGPIFHRRRVMGVNGRTFDAFKFRTMHVNGDQLLADRPDLLAELARAHKLRDDPRVTRIGQFLRKYSLDELPQLFNVLKRDMSLVGPRMISPQEMEKYDQWGINLLTVQPGITGLWQVSGRSDITYEERVRLDMHYIRNWTIWLDLHLLIQTIPVVLLGKGAY